MPSDPDESPPPLHPSGRSAAARVFRSGSRSEAARALLSKPLGAVATLLGLALVAANHAAIRPVARPVRAGSRHGRVDDRRVGATGDGRVRARPGHGGTRRSRSARGRDPGAPVAKARSRATRPKPPRIRSERQFPSSTTRIRSIDCSRRSTRTEHHDAEPITRVVFFGDSVVASDFGTGTLRRVLETRFGDAGHGFVLVANAWPQYFHNDVYRLADKGWHVSRIVGPRATRRILRPRWRLVQRSVGAKVAGGYGEDGHVRSERGAVRASSTSTQPGGGVLRASVDGNVVQSIDTAGPEKRAAFAELRRPGRSARARAPHGARQRASVRRRSRARHAGRRTRRDRCRRAHGSARSRRSTSAHFAESLAWRHPNLVVYQFGANESGDGFAYPMPEYHRTDEGPHREGDARHARRGLPRDRRDGPRAQGGRSPRHGPGDPAHRRGATKGRGGARVCLLERVRRDGRARARWPSGCASGSAPVTSRIRRAGAPTSSASGSTRRSWRGTRSIRLAPNNPIFANRPGPECRNDGMRRGIGFRGALAPRGSLRDRSPCRLRGLAPLARLASRPLPLPPSAGSPPAARFATAPPLRVFRSGSPAAFAGSLRSREQNPT